MSVDVFSRNPIRSGVLRSSVGWIYGICSRRLFYACRDNKIDVPPQQVFQNGINKHKELQATKFKDYVHEHYAWRDIPTINGVFRVGATIDCINSERIIEIKPRYKPFGNGNSMPTYVQTLIERFVYPKMPIWVYSYRDDQEFQLKADYEKSKMYIARVLTTIKDIPPKIPNADKTKRPCSECLFQKECWSSESRNDKKAWEEWTREFVEPNYEVLKDL
jgi:CRISPR/Cas system-associated exonuclease Cas4 (RecB family)